MCVLKSYFCVKLWMGHAVQRVQLNSEISKYCRKARLKGEYFTFCLIMSSKLILKIKILKN